MRSTCWSLWWCQQEPYRVWEIIEATWQSQVQIDAWGQNAREAEMEENAEAKGWVWGVENSGWVQAILKSSHFFLYFNSQVNKSNKQELTALNRGYVYDNQTVADLKKKDKLEQVF